MERVNYYFACYQCNECIEVASDHGGWTFYGSLPTCSNELGDWLREQAERGCEPALVSGYRVRGLDERVWRPSSANEKPR